MVPIDLKALKARILIPFLRALTEFRPIRFSTPLSLCLSLFFFFFTLRHTDLKPSPRYRVLGLLFVVLGKFPSGCTRIGRRRHRTFLPLLPPPLPAQGRFVRNVIGTAVRYRAWNERVPDTFTIGEQYNPAFSLLPHRNFPHKMIYGRAISRAFYF